MRTSRAKKKQRGAGFRIFWWTVLSAGICVLIYAGTHMQNPPGIPEQLLGTWRSTEPSYEGRTFELGLANITFGVGEGKAETGFIEKVETDWQDHHFMYTVHYVQDGVESQCSFYAESQGKEVLYFKNQPRIKWVKDKDDL